MMTRIKSSRILTPGGITAGYVYMADGKITAVTDENLPFDTEIVAFDLETTGLSSQSDVIIEIGAAIFRGGEIVPVLFTGCAFGTLVGPMLGLPHGFSGALGMAAVFCGATNCPLSSILLSYELFGGQSLPVYALTCGVSYVLSGYYGLYSEQKIVYSKFRPEWIDRQAE